MLRQFGVLMPVYFLMLMVHSCPAQHYRKVMFVQAAGFDVTAE
jgi:hypothetical protein